jgi:hypothetical protein
MKIDKDPDALYDDDVVARLVIAVRRNGAMSVEGCINDEPYALAMLDNAKDTIKSHNMRRRMSLGGKIIIPANATGLRS